MVVPAFRLFWLFGHSGFPVILAFQSFWLSGRSGFPDFLAFQSFWLSGRSRFSSAVQVTAIKRNIKSIEQAQIWLALPICKEIGN
jgi:hypothetical protein